MTQNSGMIDSRRLKVMNTQQHSVLPSLPKTARPTSAPYRRRATLRSQRRLRVQLFETLTLLGITLGVSISAITGLSRLVPYAVAQQAKLQTLQAEVKATRARVQQLQTEYKQDLNPEAKERIAQQEGNLLHRNQRRIVWLAPKPKTLRQP
jgi:cell division protein FtsB